MNKRKGSSTNAAPSALNAQAQSGTGSLLTEQANQSPAQPTTDASTVQTSQPASTVETSQIKSDVQEKQGDNNTATDDVKVEDAASATATDIATNDRTDADGDSGIDSNPTNIKQSTAENMPPSEPTIWILRVHNLTGCRLYEPHSNIWLEAHQITEIESKTVKHHQQVTANVQELSRLKRGRVEIIND